MFTRGYDTFNFDKAAPVLAVSGSAFGSRKSSLTMTYQDVFKSRKSLLSTGGPVVAKALGLNPRLNKKPAEKPVWK